MPRTNSRNKLTFYWQHFLDFSLDGFTVVFTTKMLLQNWCLLTVSVITTFFSIILISYSALALTFLHVNTQSASFFHLLPFLCPCNSDYSCKDNSSVHYTITDTTPETISIFSLHLSSLPNTVSNTPQLWQPYLCLPALLILSFLVLSSCPVSALPASVLCGMVACLIGSAIQSHHVLFPKGSTSLWLGPFHLKLAQLP